eukprot:SAG11_NODE_2739_length_3025_cov_1.861586_2_plen_124_part_00
MTLIPAGTSLWLRRGSPSSTEPLTLHAPPTVAARRSAQIRVGGLSARQGGADAEARAARPPRPADDELPLRAPPRRRPLAVTTTRARLESREARPRGSQPVSARALLSEAGPKPGAAPLQAAG